MKYDNICRDYKEEYTKECKHTNNISSLTQIHYCELLENIYESCLKFKLHKTKKKNQFEKNKDTIDEK